MYLTVNSVNCVKCSICTKVCPTGAISLKESGPVLADEEGCVSCGHCVAVCPHSALTHSNNLIEMQQPFAIEEKITNEQAAIFLRSRRSIRCYKKEVVPEEKLLKLVNIGRYAPTAGNSQRISYLILKNIEVINQLTESVIQWMEELLSDPAGDVYWSFKRHVHNYRENGVDSIFRGAPTLIFGLAPTEFANGRENCISQMTYMELYAPMLGLGSCWAGLFEMCAFSGYRPIKDLLQIPPHQQITGALMVGIPQYSYHRLVEREKLTITIK